MRIALIPVADLASAKTRLAPLLDDGARRDLTVAMYRDVLDATLACPALDAVAAVTRDAELLAIAEEAGAQPMAEPGDLNGALDAAAALCAARSDVERICVIAADLPLASSSAIATVFDDPADVALVPADDGGTNALAVAPAAFVFRYGPDSADKHTAAANDAGLSVSRLDLPELALDIDTPADLQRLRDAVASGLRPGARTRALLQKLKLLELPAGGGHAKGDPARGGQIR